MSKIKYFIEQSWLLIVASFCFGLLIAVANAAWSPRIEQNKIEKINRLMSGLLPNAKSFELTQELQIDSAKGKKIKTKIYKAVSVDGGCIGWSFNTAGPGFADKIELIIAVDESFEEVAGFDVLASNETPGFGDQINMDYFRDQFKGVPTGLLSLEKTGDRQVIDSQIVAIGGATVSSNAVVDICNNSILQVRDKMQDKGLLRNGK